MRKMYFLGFLFAFVALFAQKQSDTVFFVGNESTTDQFSAQMIIDDVTGMAGLVISAPADRWFAFGFGTTVVSGFGMGSGDVIVYTTDTTPVLTDRKYIGAQEPSIDASQDWTVESDVGGSDVRVLTLTRPLDTGDDDDFTIDYATTNTLNVAWAISSTAAWPLAYHGATNRGFAVLTFTDLSVDETTLEEASVEIVPTQITTTFEINSNKEVLNVDVYDINGRTVFTSAMSEKYDISSLGAGVYFVQVGLEGGESHFEKIVKQ